jgi:hypothetical protein
MARGLERRALLALSRRAPAFGERGLQASLPNDMEWLLVEWPKGEAEPAKYWFSALSDDTPLETLVDITKLRWRIERDYQELESELGLAHYEGARVAWLSPPRDALHRRLWFSDPRESDDSPLSCQNQLIIPKLTA